MFYEKFKGFKEKEEIIKKSQNNCKYIIDTVLINKIILRQEGLKEGNIIDSKICTACNKDVLHSYRRNNDLAGRNTALFSIV